MHIFVGDLSITTEYKNATYLWFDLFQYMQAIYDLNLKAKYFDLEWLIQIYLANEFFYFYRI